MKKSLCLIIACILLTFVLCSCNESTVSTAGSIYDFEQYQNEHVFDFEKIELDKNLSTCCTSYKFTYLSDGYKIKAFVSIPQSLIDDSTKGKCILYNRGGNSKIGLLSDDDTANLCVATNRIVIASQYRGAGFVEGKDQFGGEDLNDVIKLIDLCETHFDFIDMDDFCSLGVSRGGMMTYMAARQDNRIKKIIAVSAVSDLFKSYEERDDMQMLLNNYIGTTPQISPSEYEKRSAIYWADEIKAPTLIIHSQYDEQVSFSQAEEMYNKLKTANKNVAFIPRDDDTHGFSKDDSDAVLNWLKKDFNYK